jgi:hypothetical protein
MMVSSCCSCSGRTPHSGRAGSLQVRPQPVSRVRVPGPPGCPAPWERSPRAPAGRVRRARCRRPGVCPLKPGQADAPVNELVGGHVLGPEPGCERLVLSGEDRREDVQGLLDAAHIKVAERAVSAIADQAEQPQLVNPVGGQPAAVDEAAGVGVNQFEDQVDGGLGIFHEVDLGTPSADLDGWEVAAANQRVYT